jgi:hypothetical protein
METAQCRPRRLLPFRRTSLQEAPMPTKPISDDVLWGVDDVARFLKTSKSWVYQKAEAGLLPCIRICGLLRFDPEAIRALARGEQPPTGRIIAIR